MQLFETFFFLSTELHSIERVVVMSVNSSAMMSRCFQCHISYVKIFICIRVGFFLQFFVVVASKIRCQFTSIFVSISTSLGSM